LIKNDRKRLHQSVGEALEQLYPQQLDELAATLAYHFEKAEQLEKAVHYLTRAGNQASEGFANTEALAFYQSAIAQAEQVLQQMPNEPGRSLLAQLFEKSGDVRERIGQHEAARESYYRALETQATLTPPDNVMQVRLYRKIGGAHTLQRQYDEAIRAWEHAETYLGDLSHPHPGAVWNEWIDLQIERVLFCYWQNDVAGMKQFCDRLLPVVEQIGTKLQQANALYSHSLYLFRVQRSVVSDEVMAVVNNNVLVAAQTKNLTTLFDHHFTAGFFHLLRRELNEAETHLHTCFELAQRMGDPIRISRAGNYLMFAGRMRGQPEVVQSYFDIVLSTTWAGPVADYTFTVRACQSWIAWREGRLAEARSLGLKARETLLGPFQHYPFQWFVYFPLIGVAVAEEQITEAIEYATLILDPKQMILPADLTAALEQAVQSCAQADLPATQAALQEVVGLAVGYGFL
jgi:eukaryotic-like serine/threonine-protein kinase